MKKTQRAQVAALVDTTTSWGRNLVRGINNYNRNHGIWHLWIQSRAQDTKISLPPKWRGNGIIACLSDENAVAEVKSRKIAVVNVSAAEIKGVDFPQVAVDQRAAGIFAAKHLLDRGFVNFAYYGLEGRSLIHRHYEHFAAAVSKVCNKCEFYKTPGVFSTTERNVWQDRQKQLIRWLQKLPKPVAIVVWNAELGREVIFACQQKNFWVPEQIAVLVTDDDLLCEACTPSLSAVRLNSQQIGYEAAAMLDQMMQGKQLQNRSLFIPPTSVVTRQSTDTLAIDDVELSNAITFIRQNADRPIQVADILRIVPVSRRLLERHFQNVLGRSPAQEIRRVHIERAKQLLSETDLSIPEVAERSGFGSSEHFARYFKAQTGTSPVKFRSTMQGR